jgi:uncharacterized membrane protein YgdD (TMEM256/DUF423 family)
VNLHPHSRKGLLIGLALLALAVLIGAFGAHGLRSIVTEERLATFETGVRYHFYHGFGILMAAFFQQLFPQAKMSMVINCFLVGILLFSFDCYFYVLSGVKVFAMIVPVGGVLFVLGWILMLKESLKLKSA